MLMFGLSVDRPADYTTPANTNIYVLPGPIM